MTIQIKEIPLSNDIQNYKFQINIGGTVYTIRIKYNYRMSRWFIDFRTVDDVAIVVGLPLLLGVDVLQHYKSNASLPNAAFVLVNFKSDTTEIDKTALGVDGFLHYTYDDGA